MIKKRRKIPTTIINLPKRSFDLSYWFIRYGYWILILLIIFTALANLGLFNHKEKFNPETDVCLDILDSKYMFYSNSLLIKEQVESIAHQKIDDFACVQTDDNKYQCGKCGKYIPKYSQINSSTITQCNFENKCIKAVSKESNNGN